MTCLDIFGRPPNGKRKTLDGKTHRYVDGNALCDIYHTGFQHSENSEDPVSCPMCSRFEAEVIKLASK